MAARKSFEMISGIDRNQSLQSNLSQMKCDVWKPCGDQRWPSGLGRASIFDLKIFELSDFKLVNNHLLCYWPTIHNLISKICPKFQAISSHVFEVNELLNEHLAKIVQSEKISTPIYFECNKMYRFAFKNSGMACLALIFNLTYLRLTILHPKNWMHIAKHVK